MIRFKDDRGALINTLVFVTVGFLLTSMMTGWMMSRITADYSQAQSAQVRSAVDEYAQNLLERVNLNGPNSIKPKAEGSTDGTKAYAALKSRVELTSWPAKLAADGSITAKIKGVSTVTNPVAKPISITVRYTLVGAGHYVGVNPNNGRPIWTKASGNTDPTALWQIAPSG